jgi:hypothetical protein
LCASRSVIKLRHEIVEEMTEGQDLEVILLKLMGFLADILNYSPKLLRLIAIALLEMHWKANVFCNEYLPPELSWISRYLALSVQRGRIRRLDPIMVTTVPTTMVFAHPWISQHTLSERTIYSDGRAAEHGYTEFWLDVLVPRSAMHSSWQAASQAGREPVR